MTAHKNLHPHPLKPWLQGAAFVVVMAALGSEARAQEFKTHRLRVEGEIHEAWVVDLHADGRKEILVALTLRRDRTPERILHIYGWQGKGHDASPFLREVWKVSPDAVFWDVGPADDGAGGNHCFFLSPDGLFELCREGEGSLVPRQRIDAPLFLAAGQEDEFLRLDFLKDWDGDGRVEACLPLGREARFYRNHGAAGWEVVDSVRLEPFPYYNNNKVFGRNVGSYQHLAVLFYPLLEAVDLNGNGRKDLLVLRNGMGYGYLRGENGKLDEKPFLWDLEIRTEEEKARRRASLTYRVVDLNRDGCADVVVHKVSMKFASWSGETAIFLGRPGEARPREPDMRLSSPGILSGVSVEDLNGDGHADMTLWSVKMGLLPLVEIFLRRIVHVKSQSYYGPWPDGFSGKPASQRDFVFHLDSNRQDFFRGLVPNTDGDFNRDGVKDLVANRGENNLAVYLGSPQGGFASRPWAVMEAPGVNYVSAEDLNGDGLCDLYGYQVESGVSFLHVWIQGS